MTTMYEPRHYQFIINTVELHVLKTPAFIDSLGHEGLADSCEVWGVEHSNNDPL
jgi:hypothetical protein